MTNLSGIVSLMFIVAAFMTSCNEQTPAERADTAIVIVE